MLFFAGSTYAVIKTVAIEGWHRISSKRIEDETKLVKKGRYDFAPLEPLLFKHVKNDEGDRE